MRKLLIAGVVIALALPGRGSAEPAATAGLVAHEWGTFTALQDDDGTAVGAINADDEPVPAFVCRAGSINVASARSPFSPMLQGGKGLPPCHPGVTMRLETPVIYFYPPVAGPGLPTVDVRVKFRGGWLTEFYPRAEVDAPDLLASQQPYPSLTSTTRGGLAWNRLELGATGALTATDDPVWTVPREVARAAVVRVPRADGKSDDATNRPEKFLFYRGVGHLDSPLRGVRDKNTDVLSVQAHLGASAHPGAGSGWHVPAAWLLEIRPEDGRCAFRPLAAMDLGGPSGQSLVALPASFSPDEFSAGRLSELRESMRQSLVAAGLFPDEAAAMLKTWELSYFQSPGRRLFYIAPHEWVDEVLPLSIDGAAITRVIMGRIELVTPGQRQLLARIAAGPCPDLVAFSKACWQGLNESSAAWSRRTDNGRTAEKPWSRPSFAEMKVAVPALYQDYLNLGRFRDALILHETRLRPTSALTAFITGNGLQVRAAGGLFSTSFLSGDEHSR